MTHASVSALVKFVRESGEAATVEELLDRALEVALEGFSGWHGWVRVERGGKPLEVRKSALGLQLNDLDQVCMNEIRDEMLSRRTIVVHVPDSAADAAGVAVPVWRGTEIGGSIVVLCEQGGDVSPEEIEFARVLGEQVSVALDRIDGAKKSDAATGPVLTPAAFAAEAQRRLARAADGAPGVAMLAVGLVGGEEKARKRTEVLLRAMGSAIASALRSGDRVGRAGEGLRGPVFRVLAEAADGASAAILAERVMRALQSIPVEGPRFEGAVGGVRAPDDGLSAEALTSAADEELARALKGGAGMFCLRGSEPRLIQVVDPEIDSLLLSRVGRQALVMACRLVERGFEVEGVAREALDLIGRAVRADRGLVMGGADATVVLASNAETSLDFSQTFVQRALAQRRPLLVEDVMREGARSPSDSAVMMGIQSVICVPIESVRRVVGVLYLDRRMGGRFGAEDLRLAELFARRIAPVVDQAIHQAEQSRKLAALEEVLETSLEELSRKYRYGDIVGRSESMQRVIRRMEQVKDLPYPIIIQGSTGAGKELVAKSIHYNGRRRARPFVAVNCGAVPAALAESEFFGHVKGAFTGALDRRTGYFEMAQGGTLFLDEIEEMPEHLQVMLLRVLEEKKIRPIGALQETAVDVRVIAATNKPLGPLVEGGRLRKDLYYRLNGVTIEVPALAERREDIPLLVDHFLDVAAKEMGEAKKEPTRRAMVALASYAWPGNVRELKNEVQRLAVFAGKRIDVTDLPATILGAPASGPRPSGDKYEDARAAFEREFFLKALEKHAWRIASTAKFVGLSRNGLKAKLDRLDIHLHDA